MKKMNNTTFVFFSILVFLILKNANSAIIEKYKVVDGDSLELNGVEIRLKDIDTPEFSQKCYDENDAPYECGKMATKILVDYVKEGIQCHGKSKDIYDRFLMECFDKKQESINKKMVSDGWAVAYGKRFEKEEKIAKDKKIGIWKGRFIRPELYRALQKKLKKR